MRPVVFSASSVNAYLDCHLRWWFAYVLAADGVESEAQRVGISVHEAAEHLLRGTRPRDAFDDWPSSVTSLIDVFERDIHPTYRDPVLIEAPFQIEVDGIPFSGIIDSVDRQDVPPGPEVDWDSEGRDLIVPPGPAHALILRDLKTTASRPRAGKYRFNLTGYWLGARDLGYEPDIMQLDYIVRTKTPYYWPEAVPAPDENDLAIFASTLKGVADLVDAGDYRPTGLGTPACSACPYAAMCGPYQRFQEATSPLRKEVSRG